MDTDKTLQYKLSKLSNDKVYNLLKQILPIYTLEELNNAIYMNRPINFIAPNNTYTDIGMVVSILNKILNKRYKYSYEEAKGVTNIYISFINYTPSIKARLSNILKELNND